MGCKCKRKTKSHKKWCSALVLVLWWVGVWGLIDTGLHWGEASYAQRAIVYAVLAVLAIGHTVKMGRGVL